MADAVVAEPVSGLGLAQGVRQPEVRVADHPEDRIDAPVHHDVDHLVHDRRLLLEHGQLDVEPVVPLFDGIGGGHVVVAARGLTGPRVVLVAVPWADDTPVLDLAVTEGPALVGAVVVEHAVALRRSGDAEGPAAGDDRGDRVDVHRARVDPVPLGASLVLSCLRHRCPPVSGDVISARGWGPRRRLRPPG